MVKLTILDNVPADRDSFDERYFKVQVPTADS